MIDPLLRAKYAEQLSRNKSDTFVKEVSNRVNDSIKVQKDTNRILSILEENQKKEAELFSKLGKALALIFNKIPGATYLPKVFQVRGSVDITNPVTIEETVSVTGKVKVINPVTEMTIKNFPDFEQYFTNLSKRIVIPQPLDTVSIDNWDMMGAYTKSIEDKLDNLTQAIQSIPQPKEPKIEFPKIEFPKSEPPQPIDLSPIVDGLSELKELFEDQPKSDDTAILRKIQESLQSLASRPVMTPQPVTNITLNGLQGFIKTTDNTVGMTATSLPNYGQLFNRRAVQIYNNSANTIYVGGSDVTISNGIPVTAGSFSAIFDAGYNMVLYGIAATNGNDVRTLEVSKDQTQNIQE